MNGRRRRGIKIAAALAVPLRGTARAALEEMYYIYE